MKHWFHRRLVYLALSGLRPLASGLSLRANLVLGRCLGDIAFFVLGRERRRTIANLTAAFSGIKSGAEMFRLAARVFENLGKNLLECFYLSGISAFDIDRLVFASGLEKIDREREKGRGVIIISAHLGNWELLAAFLASKDYPTNVIARRLYYPPFEKMVSGLRKKKGVRVIDRDDAPWHAFQVLKRNELLGILPDQDVDSVAGVFVDFFGRPAYTPTGPVSLALASGASIVPCYLVRENGGHRLIVEDPLEMVVTGDRERDLKENTEKWSRVTESYIARYPAQWVWMHRRWKTRVSPNA